MSFVERGLIFDCENDDLVGVLTSPDAPIKVGVVVVVGGPQYRAGSHRQFVLLARRLAVEGFATLRFDCRGMGDSTGPAQSFEDAGADIAAAVDALRAACPAVEQVVLWGLCDGASAALLYWHATRDARIAGMVLLNPWVRSDESLAATHLKHYYGQRAFDRAFWAKLARGDVDVAGSLRSIVRGARAATGARWRPVQSEPVSFQDRMAVALRMFDGQVRVILSGRDLTAKEFAEDVRTHPRWRGVFDRRNIERHEVLEADHTFSSAALRSQVETLTLGCVAALAERR
jgi:uncharacterized protein